jgi:predicted nuclease with TOPRIM domain
VLFRSRRDDAGFEKRETKEASRTYSNGSKDNTRGLRKAISNNRNYSYGKGAANVNEEVQKLREKNEEYRKALNVFREKLNEVAVFNSNLAYATRLFTEHTTTKQEKINILRRFDDVETLKESKNLYTSIKNELGSNKSQTVVTESFERIEKSPASGSAQNLIESKTYENPQFLRMKDIMSKIAK